MFLRHSWCKWEMVIRLLFDTNTMKNYVYINSFKILVILLNITQDENNSSYM